jgi:hypothetical protein
MGKNLRSTTPSLSVTYVTDRVGDLETRSRDFGTMAQFECPAEELPVLYQAMNTVKEPPKPGVILATPLNVEESRAQRQQRSQARFRDRGG